MTLGGGLCHLVTRGAGLSEAESRLANGLFRLRMFVIFAVVHETGLTLHIIEGLNFCGLTHWIRHDALPVNTDPLTENLRYRTSIDATRISILTG
jgi:hypothetical protein